MIKFGPEDYEKKTWFQAFLTSTGFGVSSTAYKALTAEGIETMGSLLPNEAKLFSKENLDNNRSHGLTTGEILKLQNLWM